nr:MAG TPA: hypothetical protein [Caudoviricetes sp.]
MISDAFIPWTSPFTGPKPERVKRSKTRNQNGIIEHGHADLLRPFSGGRDAG